MANNSSPGEGARQEREAALFAAALARPANERATFLDGACQGDRALRERLQALLAAHEQPATELAEAGEVTVQDAHDVQAVGQTLGHYKLLERLGEGGCGIVYVAEQTEPVRRRVALKVIKLGMDTKAVVARFEAERQAAGDDGSSQHCQSIGCGRDGNRASLFRDGTGAGDPNHRVLRSAKGEH